MSYNKSAHSWNIYKWQLYSGVDNTKSKCYQNICKPLNFYSIIFPSYFIFWKSDIFFSSRLAIVSSLGTLVWNTWERNSWIVIEPFFRFRPSKKSFPKLYLFFPLFLESTRRGYGSPPLNKIRARIQAFHNRF